MKVWNSVKKKKGGGGQKKDVALKDVALNSGFPSRLSLQYVREKNCHALIG